ncbi:MAG: hypothetical protein NT067_03815 [Candidatus Diapherotrites archaeon]|nr:hypothetical protein [Candidatus Diapherotrites archaeon]
MKRGSVERHKSNAGKYIVAVLILAIAAFLVYNFFKPGEPEIVPSDETTTISDEPSWDHPVSTSYFYIGDFFFGGSDDEVHNLSYFYFSDFNEGAAVVGVDTNDFYFVLDPDSDRFGVVSDWEADLGIYSFTPGKISTETISFGQYPVRYNYYVSSDRERLFLFLSAQDFPMQFSKTMWFKGTDSTDSGSPGLPYFLPSLDEFGYVKGQKPGTAIFSFDEDEDGKEDIFYYMDTLYWAPIEPGSRDSYQWQVVFPHNGRKLGFNLLEGNEMKIDSYGSLMRRGLNVFYVTMPAKNLPLPSPTEEDWIPEEETA